MSGNFHAGFAAGDVNLPGEYRLAGLTLCGEVTC